MWELVKWVLYIGGTVCVLLFVLSLLFAISYITGCGWEQGKLRGIQQHFCSGKAKKIGEEK